MSRFFTVLLSSVVVFLSACGVPLVAHAPVALPTGVETAGETIYFGKSFPLGKAASEPEFIYERRVGSRDGVSEATHLTRTKEGVIALADSATYTESYELIDYTLYFDQQGRSGSIEVDDERGVTLTYNGKSKTEAAQGPVVVGPTLVGFLFHRLDALRAGEKLVVRFAVLDRLETMPFEFTAESAPEGSTKIVMKAQSALVALAIAPVHFTFETATGKLVRIEGRVPPKLIRDGALYDFDARVEYEFSAPAYR